MYWKCFSDPQIMNYCETEREKNKEIPLTTCSIISGISCVAEWLNLYYIEKINPQKDRKQK